jgi:hypothetical protein
VVWPWAVALVRDREAVAHPAAPRAGGLAHGAALLDRAHRQGGRARRNPKP